MLITYCTIAEKDHQCQWKDSIAFARNTMILFWINFYKYKMGQT